MGITFNLNSVSQDHISNSMVYGKSFKALEIVNGTVARPKGSDVLYQALEIAAASSQQ